MSFFYPTRLCPHVSCMVSYSNACVRVIQKWIFIHFILLELPSCPTLRCCPCHPFVFTLCNFVHPTGYEHFINTIRIYNKHIHMYLCIKFPIINIITVSTVPTENVFFLWNWFLSHSSPLEILRGFLENVVSNNSTVHVCGYWVNNIVFKS